MNLAEIMIFLLGAPALWLVGRPEKWARWGFILGLTAQPAWYFETVVNKQWGMLALNVIYTFSWCQGIYFRFIKTTT